MSEQARACAAYFQSRPEYRRILSELLKKYRSYGRPAGTVRLDDATREECDAARSIFGRPFSPPLRFQTAQFEAGRKDGRRYPGRRRTPPGWRRPNGRFPPAGRSCDIFSAILA